MHIADHENGNLGANAIVGGSAGIATGAALSAKRRGTDQVAVCFFGEGALGQGIVYEVMNMAALWALPVVYVCENNKYGMGTEFTRVAAEAEIYKRASAYKMRGEQLNGRNVIKFYEGMKDCIDYARSGKGPVLVEALCYRFRGHSMADPATYRTKTEVEEERTKNDCIEQHRELLLSKKHATEKELEEIDAEVKKEVDAAVKFADESPEPSLDELWRDTIVEEGEEDVKPRERVLGAKDVKWPTYPKDFKVTWDLEPRGGPAEKKAG